jgi:uncharacterized repeat protein (TIGR01451 family)
LLLLASFLGLMGAAPAFAQIGTTQFVRETGRVNFVSTGGSLRNSATSTCSLTASSTTALSGMPAVGTNTIRGAYLYWGGSGSVDNSVTFNGATVTADRTFTTTYAGVNPNLPFFGAMADITSRNIVNLFGNNTFTNLAVNAGSPHCDVSAVVSGWALIVIYENPNERVRAVNLYDGLDWFRGRQIQLTPSGFRVPNTNIDGRIAIFTLEGDPANSGAMNGVSEALRYNGNLLDDGINVPGSDPTVQQFDGTINTQGIQTSYGIDVDQYNISAFLSPGQTSGTTLYSSGEDLVLLMAQIVSATSDPGVDLSLTKTHTGSFIAGSTGTYTLTVSNSSAALIEREDNTVTVTDTLPAGLTFNAATGAGWTCGASGQVVTCTHAAPLDVGASFPPITLTVDVLESAPASVDNQAVVTTPSFELNSANNSVTDTTAIVFPNLSTSTKTVQDLNGGDAAPGDTLRYTITLSESAGFAAPNVSVTDHIPANSTFGSFVSIPAGATSTFTPPPAGDDNKGVFTVSGITVPANGSSALVFDVIVDNVSPGSTIDNTATVSNPNGPDATPAAPTVVVLASQIPTSGTKQLYLWSNPVRLTRVRPTGTHAGLTIDGNNATQTFSLNVPLQTSLTLNNGNFPVNLILTRTGSSGSSTRTITVTLRNSALGTVAAVTRTINNMPNVATMTTFTLNTAQVTAPAGSVFHLDVNNGSGSGTRDILLTPYSALGFSRIDLNSATVINVDSVTTWNAAFNGGAAQGSFYPGATVFVRAQVSDPFGSFDISSARISIIDPASVTQVNDQLMTAQGAPATCNSTTAAVCIFEYAFTVPASPTVGSWTARVTAHEGVEGVTDLGVGTFQVVVPQPALTIVKSSTIISDPVNAANPKRIPNAIVGYEITVTNSGPGTVDSNTLVITDAIPTGTVMYVSTTSGNPVAFANGATASGLVFDYASNVSYSSAGASGPWTYTPVPDAQGFDPLVRAVRIAPAGVMNAASGGNNPSFIIQFRVRIN